MLTLEETKERILKLYDPDDLLEALQINSEEILERFEDKLINRISKEVKRNGKLEKDLKDLVVKSFREFFNMMFHHRSYWETKFRNS